MKSGSCDVPCSQPFRGLSHEPLRSQFAAPMVDGARSPRFSLRRVGGRRGGDTDARAMLCTVLAGGVESRQHWPLELDWRRGSVAGTRHNVRSRNKSINSTSMPELRGQTRYRLRFSGIAIESQEIKQFRFYAASCCVLSDTNLPQGSVG